MYEAHSDDVASLFFDDRAGIVVARDEANIRPLPLDDRPIDRTCRVLGRRTPRGVNAIIVAAGQRDRTAYGVVVRSSTVSLTTTTATHDPRSRPDHGGGKIVQTTTRARKHSHHDDVPLEPSRFLQRSRFVLRIKFYSRPAISFHLFPFAGVNRSDQMMLDILHRHVVRDMDGFPRISTCKYLMYVSKCTNKFY